MTTVGGKRAAPENEVACDTTPETKKTTPTGTPGGVKPDESDEKRVDLFFDDMKKSRWCRGHPEHMRRRWSAQLIHEWLGKHEVFSWPDNRAYVVLEHRGIYLFVRVRSDKELKKIARAAGSTKEERLKAMNSQMFSEHTDLMGHLSDAISPRDDPKSYVAVFCTGIHSHGKTRDSDMESDGTLSRTQFELVLKRYNDLGPPIVVDAEPQEEKEDEDEDDEDDEEYEDEDEDEDEEEE